MDETGIDAQERRVLRQARGRARRAALALQALLLAIVLLLFGPPSWIDPIPPYARAAMLLLCLGWVVLLRDSAVTADLLDRDLRDPQLRVSEGIATLLPRRGLGLIAPLRWRLALGGRGFDLSGFDPASVPTGTRIRARWAACSGQLLSLHPHVAADVERDAETLAERERALLRALARGLSDKLIARELGLSPATVRTYNSALFRRIGVSDRRGAIAWARAQGFTDVD